MRGIDASRSFYERDVAPLLGGIPHATPALPDGVELHTLQSFIAAHLGVDPVDDIDWLLLTGRSVLEVIAGAVFRDDTGEPTALRSKLQWVSTRGRALPGRGVVAPHRPGAAVHRSDAIAATRRAPRSSPRESRRPSCTSPSCSIGSGRRTRSGSVPRTAPGRRSTPRTRSALRSTSSPASRQAGKPVTVPFHDRPFRTVDPLFLATMPSDGIGSVEMWCDNVDVLAKPWRRVQLRKAYEAWRER